MMRANQCLCFKKQQNLGQTFGTRTIHLSPQLHRLPSALKQCLYVFVSIAPIFVGVFFVCLLLFFVVFVVVFFVCFFALSLFCHAVLSVLSSFAIIWLRQRELAPRL